MAQDTSSTGAAPAAPARDLIIKNFMAGLTTSFVVVSLGAAFGVMSGRGAFAGMISAAIIGIVVALLGGTRIAVSGPTGPMTTVTAVVVAFSYDEGAKRFPTLPPEQFISIILLMTSCLTLLAAALRLGKLIRWVPQVVISGFMNGIAVLIWIDVVKRFTATGGKQPLTGVLWQNIALAAVALLVSWRAGPYLKKLTGRWSALFPATLVALIVTTGVSLGAGLDVERTKLAGIKGLADLLEMFGRFLPSSFPSAEVLWVALPTAASLALLNFLDTLMTALVMDKMTGAPSNLDRELFGQGVSIAAIVPFGGIPGAQATIRSVLLFKEGATARWAAIVAGTLALVQVLLLQDLIGWIPQAVFMGIVFKVGIDVFEWAPLQVYLRQLRGSTVAEPGGLRVSHVEMLLIAGTTVVTVLADLNLAVFTFTALFYLLRRGFKVRIDDLTPPVKDGDGAQASESAVPPAPVGVDPEPARGGKAR